MESQTVFEKGWELDRLTVQNQLLRECELPVYQKLLEGKSGLRLLDVGCNDGSKTMDRFDLPQVERIMGLEYNEGLARRAQEKYGGGKASFHSCDLEDPDFPVQMAGLMEADGIEGFDLIYISFVLMHLKRPDLTLARLRPLLAPGGCLLIEEADDAACRLEPDEQGLFRQFIQMLPVDPYAGNRRCGEQVAGWLERCGYREIADTRVAVTAEGGQKKKKENIFEIFFSYLPQDLSELWRREPNNSTYAFCVRWLDQNYEALRAAVISRETRLNMGIRIISCGTE